VSVVVPRTLTDALRAMAANPSALLLQGGTDLMVEINFNHRKPVDVIALRKIHELRAVKIDGETISIGAGLPYQEMESGQIAELVPALGQAARTVGSPQIRAAGSLGGNLGTCSPAGDGLPVLSALDAMINLRSANASRSVSIHEFMVGVKRNAKQPGEIIVSATVPIVRGWQGFAKVGVRNAMVISVASCCLVVDRTKGSIAVALGAVGPTVIRCRQAEQWLSTNVDLKQDAMIGAKLAKEFGERVANEARPIDDHRGTAEYRRHAVATLASRLLQRSGAR